MFKNGVDRSDAEPWGGGPFSYPIDLLEYIPNGLEYAPLHQLNVVSWAEEAEPRVLTSVDELRDARVADEVEITPMGVVVTALIVSWPDDPFPDHPRSNGNGE